jgi:hypothetical protein
MYFNAVIRVRSVAARSSTIAVRTPERHHGSDASGRQLDPALTADRAT